jgi:large repetitive protein
MALGTAASVLLLSVVGSSMLSVASAATDQSALTITTTAGNYNSPLTLATSGGSDGGAVTYSVTSAGTAVCSISGATLTATNAGTCSVTATMAGNTSFNAVSSEPTTITIAPIGPAALTITSTTGSYDTSLALSTSGGSNGGIVAYVVDNAGTAGCSVSGATLSATSVGTCTVTAIMAATTDFLTVSSATTTITIGKVAQSALTITTTAGSYKTPITLATSGGSDGGAVTYAVDAAGSAECSVAGATLSATSAGTCTITAAMAANTDYTAVSSAATTITIGKIDQAALTITSTLDTYGVPLALTVTGGSDNGSISYSVDAAGSAGCSVASAVLSATSAGSCAVTATEAANGNYDAVSSPATTVTIAKASQAPLTIRSTSGLFGSPLTLAAIGGSDAGSVTYALDAVGSAGCSISGGTLSSTGTGTCTVTATMATNADYSAVSSPPTTTTIARIAVAAAAAISSPATAHFTAFSPGSFTIKLGGTPSPVLSETGTLPAGLKLINNGSGTATISGFTALLALGTHRVTLVATNGVGARVTRTIDIVVGFAPVLTTPSGATFTAGRENHFVVGSLGYPNDSLTESGTLPAGVSFSVHGNGTATVAGKPSAATVGSYHVSVAAKNVFGTSSEGFTLVVGAIPSFSSSNSTTFPVGVSTDFHVTARGSPEPTLNERGKLPIGLQFRGGRGTGTLSGTPARGTSGSYQITFTAGQGTTLSASQTFRLVVGAVPTFRSANTTTFVVGDATAFIVATKGNPAPSVTERGALPAGVRFQGGNGTGILSGTPAKGTSGTYHVTLSAGSGFASSAIQPFTLIVSGS